MRTMLMMLFSFLFVMAPVMHAKAATQAEIVALMNQARMTSLSLPSSKAIALGWFVVSFKNNDDVSYKFDMDYWPNATFTLTISIIRTIGESTTVIRIKDADANGVIDGAPTGIPVTEWQNEYDRAIALLRTLL